MMILKNLWEKYSDWKGGEQGPHRMKSKLSTLDKHLVLAREVEILYLSSQFGETQVTLEEAIIEIANKHELSYETVIRAHRELKPFIRESLTQLEILSK